MSAATAFPSPDLMFAAAAAGLTFAAVAAGTGVVRAALLRRGVLDRPNQRSSHVAPTPRGGGIAVVTALLLGLAVAWVYAGLPGRAIAGLLLPMAGLAVVSWIDDLHALGALPRLGAHFVAVAIGLWALSGPWHAEGAGAGAWLLAILLAPAWVWFINLFNFMDGIDGIAGGETLVIGGGIALIAAGAGGIAAPLWLAGLLCAAAALGFLAWNWHPARIFLGDVGSVPLGFLLGGLLLSLALDGQWAAALILPLYYLTDATLTLARRGLRGDKVWQAHREHWYQWAVQSGRSHGAVAAAVLACGAVLAGLALVAARGWPLAALLGAVLAVALLLAWMRPPGHAGWGPRTGSTPGGG